MAKNSQITIYITLGIIVMFVCGILVLWLRHDESFVETPLNIPTHSIVSFTESCLASTVEDAVQAVSLQGGYYVIPDRYIHLGYFNTPYYYYEEDISQIPSKQIFLRNIEEYINDNVGYCLDSYQVFVEQGYNISPEEPTASVTLSVDTLRTELYMHVDINNHGKISSADKFDAVMNVRLNEIYLAANEISSNAISDPYTINYGHLMRVMDSYGMRINTMQYNGSDIVYIIEDPQSIFNDNEIAFVFAVKPPSQNYPPELDVGNIVAKVGEEFSYKVQAYDREGDMLRYEAECDLFDIQSYTGEITFTPLPEDVGVHEVVLKAIDSQDTTIETIRLTIEG